MKSLNSIRLSNSSPFSETFLSADLFCNRNEIADYIYHLLRTKELDPVKVYKAADISKQNWSNYISCKNTPNSLNARKLLLGLECTVEEAEHFLSLCGLQFVNGCEADDALKMYLTKQKFTKNEDEMRTFWNFYQKYCEEHKKVA